MPQAVLLSMERMELLAGAEEPQEASNEERSLSLRLKLDADEGF